LLDKLGIAAYCRDQCTKPMQIMLASQALAAIGSTLRLKCGDFHFAAKTSLMAGERLSANRPKNLSVHHTQTEEMSTRPAFPHGRPNMVSRQLCALQ
jgi:hypothetical protein